METSNPSTIFRARFAGPVPKPGEAILFNRDPVVGGSFEEAMVAGLRVPLVVTPHTPYLTMDHEQELRKLLSENATFKTLKEWAKELDDSFVSTVIDAAADENKKYLISQVFLPCDVALFVGIVAPAQPRKSAYSYAGLNHCDVIVGGLVTQPDPKLIHEDDLVVGDQKVGHIVSGRAVVTNAFQMTRLRPNATL